MSLPGPKHFVEESERSGECPAAGERELDFCWKRNVLNETIVRNIRKTILEYYWMKQLWEI